MEDKFGEIPQFRISEDVKNVEMMKGTIQTDILVCPTIPRTGSFYTLERCLTNLTGSKWHENYLKQIATVLGTHANF